MGLPLIIGLVHVALVAPSYHVGSFDDDASYLLSAKALLAGQGLTGHLSSGEPLVGLYLPGYGALLAPIVWLAPHSYTLARLLSVAFYAATFPLTWILLRRREVPEGVGFAALLVMALGPVDATFASMVMAEAPFLVVLLLLLLAADRWLESERAACRWALAVVVAAGALLWLKQAGLGLVIGLVLWLLLARTPRKWAKAGLLAVGVGLAVLPVLAARAALGLPLAGDRYSEELGGFYQGGLVDRLVHVLPGSTWHLLSSAIPATLVPYLPPLPIDGHWPDLWKALSWQVTILCGVGMVAWFRRRRDPAPLMVVVYLGEASLWPFVNERRAILVLPLLVVWYAMGAAATWNAVLRLAGGTSARLRVVTGVAVAAAVTFAPLVAQAPRDYLFGWNQTSSDPQGSRYMAILSALNPHSAEVETDYRSTVALFSGHPTVWNAFLAATVVCYEPALLDQLAADGAAYLVLGDLNKPGVIDSPCLAGLVVGAPWAVPLLHTNRDNASVYELVGPNSANPGLGNLIDPSTPVLSTEAGDQSTSTWEWPAPVTVAQLSVGEAAATSGPTTSVTVEVRDGDGAWTILDTVAGGVGDCAGCHPFLLDGPRSAFQVTDVRVVVTAGAPSVVSDLAVIGPAATTTRS